MTTHQPIASDVQSVMNQNANHQVFKDKLIARRVVIEQAIEQGQAFLAESLVR
jgi:hypothetical protein